MKTPPWMKLKRNLERARIGQVPPIEGLSMAFALLDEVQDVLGRHVVTVDARKSRPRAHALGDHVFDVVEKLKSEISRASVNLTTEEGEMVMYERSKR